MVRKQSLVGTPLLFNGPTPSTHQRAASRAGTLRNRASSNKRRMLRCTNTFVSLAKERRALYFHLMTNSVVSSWHVFRVMTTLLHASASRQRKTIPHTICDGKHKTPTAFEHVSAWVVLLLAERATCERRLRAKAGRELEQHLRDSKYQDIDCLFAT